MLNDRIACRLLATDNGKIITKSTSIAGKLDLNEFNQLPIDLQQLIKNDKQFGVMKPRHAHGWITYKVYSFDKEINSVEMDHIIRMALFRLSRKLNLKFRPAYRDEDPDLKIDFTDPQHDPDMTGQTLAYHGYPLTGSKYYGICRINKNYFYTIHGQRLNLHFIDPEHYPDASLAKKAPTWDLDQILGHEFWHGVLGCGHDGKAGNLMSANYTMMAEYPTERDYIRGAAKVGWKAKKEQWKEERLEKWFMAKAEEFPIWVSQI